MGPGVPQWNTESPLLVPAAATPPAAANSVCRTASRQASDNTGNQADASFISPHRISAIARTALSVGAGAGPCRRTATIVNIGPAGVMVEVACHGAHGIYPAEGL